MQPSKAKKSMKYGFGFETFNQLENYHDNELTMKYIVFVKRCC